jgi:hypothetical protein
MVLSKFRKQFFNFNFFWGHFVTKTSLFFLNQFKIQIQNYIHEAKQCDQALGHTSTLWSGTRTHLYTVIRHPDTPLHCGQAPGHTSTLWSGGIRNQAIGHKRAGAWYVRLCVAFFQTLRKRGVWLLKATKKTTLSKTITSMLCWCWDTACSMFWPAPYFWLQHHYWHSKF